MLTVADLNCGSVGFRCIALRAARVEHFSTFREATHASANQIAFHANTTAQALARSDRIYGHVSRARNSKNKDAGPNSVDGRICT